MYRAGGVRELNNIVERERDGGARSRINEIWSRWKSFARLVGNIQARILFTVLYFSLIAPFGLVIRALADPLAVKHPAGSRWLPKATQPMDLDEARRQF